MIKYAFLQTRDLVVDSFREPREPEPLQYAGRWETDFILTNPPRLAERTHPGVMIQFPRVKLNILASTSCASDLRTKPSDLRISLPIINLRLCLKAAVSAYPIEMVNRLCFFSFAFCL
jgi:hypothetical protein